MSLRRLWKAFVAPRTTVLLLVLLAGMLLLNVVVPQEAVLGEEELARMITGNPRAHFFLVTLGLARLATSPVFFAVLALFFLNLTAVLVARVGPTLRRTRMRTRSEHGLAAWARMEESLAADLDTVPGGWEPARIVAALQGFGYRVRRAGDDTFWGVKHRSAPLGFLLFHLSFFLLCAGGVSIYLTRFVGTAVVTEGQEFAGDYQQVLRHAPWGDPPPPAFRLERVEPRFEAGEPVHLGATLAFRSGSGWEERRARVNDPARWGATRVLVQGAGLAPVLWLQDAAGFTVDRVAVSARTRSSGTGLGESPAPDPARDQWTEVPLAGGRLVARIEPLAPERPFPGRDELGSTPIRLTVVGPAGEGVASGADADGDGGVEGVVLFSGALRPGQGAALVAGEGPEARAEGRLVLDDLRYWAGLQIVRERGGGLLIAGFTIGILGLVWRLVLHRREVAVHRDEGRLRLVGRSEYFSGRFRSELDALLDALVGGETEGRT